MRKTLPLPILSAAGGIIACLLRFLQNRYGFETDTGLPLISSPFSVILPCFLLLVAALIAALCFRLPNEAGDSPHSFAQLFSSSNTAAVMLAVAGIFLWGIAGAYGIFTMVRGGQDIYISSAAGLFYPLSGTMRRIHIIFSALLAASAICLLPAAAASRPSHRSRHVSGNLLLLPVVYLILRLILSYREMSINASQQTYYVELLALVMLTLSLFRLSSFAFLCGNTRRFALYSSLTAVMCIAALADAATLSDRLFYGGGCFLTLGFLLLRLTAEVPTET